jgi:hypothetical protein
MLPNLNKNYLLTYLLTDEVHNQMDKADNIPLEQDSIYNQSLKTEEAIGYQSKMSSKMVLATSQNKKTTLTINTAK